MKGFPLFKAIQKKIDRINLVLREGLTGIRVIRAFNRIDDEKLRFRDANLDLMQTSIQVNRMMAVLMPIMMLVMNLTTVTIIWFGSIRVDHGTSNIGNMMAFLQYAMQILFSLLMASLLFIMLPRAQASADRINEVLATVPEITDPEHVREPDGTRRGYVEFRDVSFRYHGAEEPAVSGITFSASPGGGHGDHRQHRLREIHPHQSHSAVLRRGRRLHPDRRGRHPRDVSEGLAGADRPGAAESHPVFRHHRGQHPLRQAGRE